MLIRRSLIAGDAALRRFVPFTLDIAAQSFEGCGDSAWVKDGVRFCAGRAAWLRALPEQTSFEDLALTARTVFAALTDVADCADLYTLGADLYTLGDLYALGDLPALGYLADLANIAVRNNLAGRATSTAFAAHTDIIALALTAARTDLAGLAASYQINEARVATVLKMLAVQGEVFIANPMQKEEK